jgi:branched-chain amino acid transport system substrate-binding protein
LTLTSCSGGTEGAKSASNGLPPTVTVLATTDTTGFVAKVGKSDLRGLKLAVQQINSQHFLGNTKIKLVTKDAGGDKETAANLVSQTVANTDVSAVIGSVLSGSARAQAPIAQHAKLPIVFTQAGSQGVVIGSYTYRVTAPFSTYYAQNALDY